MSPARLLLALSLSGGAAFAACSTEPTDPLSGLNPVDDTGGEGSTDAIDELQGLTGLAIAPLDPVVETTPEMNGEVTFKVTGTFEDGRTADVTKLVDMTLADPSLGGLLNGRFVASGTRGGKSTVTASHGTITASTSITVKLKAAIVPDGATPAIPTEPGKMFTGTADATRAPTLVYPNDGVMLPANLERLEIHFNPGGGNDLFEVSFVGPTIDVRSYVRCTTPMGGGCIVELDPKTYGYVAETGRGAAPIELRVRGTKDGGSFGESAVRKVSFSEQDVQGGLYYWTTSKDTAIMRFDFGKRGALPEVFLSPSGSGLPTCVGCHALSRDGKKMVSSLGGQNDGRLVYMNDLTTGALVKSGDNANAIQFASFNPDGTRFVANYGDTGDLAIRHKLFMHDGATGNRIDAESIALPWEPDHPDWSPSGDLIAVTRVAKHRTSQKPIQGSIELLTKMGSTWSAPATLIPIAAGKSRYNPSFAPDGSFLLYSESTCPGGNVEHDGCDGDADDSAKTWAVLPKAGATPVLLTNASAPGTTDGTKTDLADTFPRMSPFKKKQGGGELTWATISSRRKAGLRDPGGRQLLWMFSIDPAKVKAGEDGSSPAFFLPFQDLATSNHIAQWTTAIVGKPPAVK
jgi:hypothetical protein